uniref:Venom S1 protease with CUB domain 5 n=1 Tax=Oncocephalus sp. TaxID=2944721 RepID=A0AB38ZEM5_9HEMI
MPGFIISALLPLLLVSHNWALHTVKNVRIRIGKPYLGIVNPEYPDKPLDMDSYLEWNLNVESYSKIKIVCDDIRMAQADPWTPECEQVYISFDDGNREEKVCGPQKSGYQYKSQGPQVTVKMVTRNGGGFIKCTAYNTGEPKPTIVHLKPDGRIQYTGSPKEPTPYFDKVWILYSPPGTRISLQCNTDLTGEPPCSKEVLTVENGEGAKEYCGDNEFNLFSKNNYAKVRLQLNEFGDLSASCLAQAVTGPNLNEYMNLPSLDIDSSEDGVFRGARKTTCKCGWANRNSARIFFGKETGENEYPWMARLNIFFYKDGVRKMFLCGGSVITKRHILTAAHCLVDKFLKRVVFPQDVSVVLGEHDRYKVSGKEKTFEIEKVFVHKDYVANKTHDIALLYLKNDIEFNEFIGPVCLYPDELPLLHKPIKIMGWGKTESGHTSSVLLKAYSIAIDNLLCNNVRPYEICTSLKPGTTCVGDSGGPLVWLDPETNRYVQVSLVSRGSYTCQDRPALSTRISPFYDWIVDRIEMTDPSAELCDKI